MSVTNGSALQIVQDVDQQRDAMQAELDAKAEAEASLHDQLCQLEQHIQQATRCGRSSSSLGGLAGVTGRSRHSHDQRLKAKLLSHLFIYLHLLIVLFTRCGCG